LTTSLLGEDDAAEMRAWAHGGGFSVDGSVRIEGADRIGLERLLRWLRMKGIHKVPEKLLK
jgi:hypothetical protein